MSKKYYWDLVQVSGYCESILYLKGINVDEVSFTLTTELSEAKAFTTNEVNLFNSEGDFFEKSEIQPKFDPVVVGNRGYGAQEVDDVHGGFNNIGDYLSKASESAKEKMIQLINKELKENKKHYHVLKVKGVDIEPFDLIDAMADKVNPKIKFYTDCIIKYIMRFPFKEDTELKDLQKIRDYANEAILRLEGEDNAIK